MYVLACVMDCRRFAIEAYSLHVPRAELRQTIARMLTPELLCPRTDVDENVPSDASHYTLNVGLKGRFGAQGDQGR